MARQRRMENVFDPPKSQTQFSEGHKSKGILDDYAERQNVSTREGTIEHTPTEEKHIVNKKYVDDNDFWKRTVTTLTPKTSGDDVETESTKGIVVPNADTYAFTLSGDSDTGLFFNKTSTQYEFHRDGEVMAIINADSGAGDITAKQDVFADRNIAAGSLIQAGTTFRALSTDRALEIADNSYAFVLTSSTTTGIFFNNVTGNIETHLSGVIKHKLDIVNGDFTATRDVFVGRNHFVVQNVFVGQDIIVPKTSGTGIKIDSAAPGFGFADILGDQFSKNTGATKPLLTAYNGAINGWLFGVGDEAFISYHIPHDYVAGSEIFLHIHWSHIGTLVTGGDVTFKATSIYSKGHNQAAFQSTPATGTFTGTASTIQYQHILSEASYSASTPTGIQIDQDLIEPDGVIELTFEVDANNLTVSSGGVPDIFVHFVDIHYQSTGIIGTKAKVPDFYT